MSTITDDQLADATFRLLAAMDGGDLDAFARALHRPVMQDASTELHWKLDQLLDWTGRRVHGDAWSAELAEACIGAALTMHEAYEGPTTSFTTLVARYCAAINMLGKQAFGAEAWRRTVTDEAALARLNAELDATAE